MYALRLSRYRFASNLHRPSPPPLPRDQQREFEELVRKAHEQRVSDAELAMHTHARQSLEPEFAGDTNPVTGEKGGPKCEPIRKWNEGDWSFNARVSDF